ncbi:Nse1 non-SMC component of SMC5-6 complex-domain-containing protein [Diplogelasinospora grovesii]|uniref:Non-structural maintenance of chromosomes element 1 homolog n=1 Tax=Diplogelasinospora grovesii TaxID=303347 RepID=A0AAN6S3L7_9PEZI|nr:Nse1 non-SMC component of SMC5-6 complex-domain-containing protein [Diplogelasinospora grovesii]
MAEEEFTPRVAGYDDTNRAFVQGFMARGTMTFPQGQRMLAGILSAKNGNRVDPQSVTLGQFESYIGKARAAVASLDFDIRRAKHQARRGEIYWAFINVADDPVSRFATVRTPAELSYIKRLLDAMFDDYNTPRMEVMAVDEAQALKKSRPPAQQRQSLGGQSTQAPSRRVDDEDEEGGGEEGQDTQAGPATAQTIDKGLKHSEVLGLLSSLLEQEWLELSEDGFYSLSPRALMELSEWLMDRYNDPEAEEKEWQRIKTCGHCKEIVTYGKRCAERDCILRLHDECEEDLFRSRREKKCPFCQTDWDGKHFVGERAVTARAAFQKGRERRGNGRRSNRSDLADAVSTQLQVAEEEEDEMEE